MARAAFELFTRGYGWARPIRSVTVRAIYLTDSDAPIQYNVWTDPEKLEKRERLDLAVEAIRNRFGKDAIRNAVLLMPMKLPEERRVELVMPTGMVS